MQTVNTLRWTIALTATGVILTYGPIAQAQWSFETLDPSFYTSTGVAVTGDGYPIVLYSGNTDGYSCDGTADVYVKVRTGLNTWIEPQAAYSPSRLRVTRPQIAINAAGDIFVVYELRWAYYTGIVKFRRTGPTTWVRDADPVLIASPGAVACGDDDPNTSNPAYMFGYNPKIAVGGDGSLHVTVSRTLNGTMSCTYAYNTGANWRTGWQVGPTMQGEGQSVAADASGDAHLAIGAGSGPLYVKIHQNAVAAGPITINTAGLGSAWGSVACEGTTAFFALGVVPGFNGSSYRDQFVWSINGTDVSAPVNVSNISGNDYSGNPLGVYASAVTAANGRVRFYWRTGELNEAGCGYVRFAYYVSYPGSADALPVCRHCELIHPCYTQPGISMAMDSAGNMYSGMTDFYGGGYIGYGYRPNTSTDLTPPSPVTLASLTSIGTHTMNLNWRTPGNGDLMGTRIAVRTDRYATSLADATQTLNQINNPNTNETLVFTGTPGQVYYFTLFAWDNNGNLSTPVNVSNRLLVRPDFNRDYDVDQEDFSHMQLCLSGPFIAQADPACADTLLDGDTDVDQSDVAAFIECLRGPGVLPPVGCAG